jgi:hypothetical protein
MTRGACKLEKLLAARNALFVPGRDDAGMVHIFLRVGPRAAQVQWQ